MSYLSEPKVFYETIDAKKYNSTMTEIRFECNK